MAYVLYTVAALYAVLHLIAAAPCIKDGGAGPRLMALGGLLAMAGAVLGYFGIFPTAPILFTVGGAAVCWAAVLNGKAGGKVNIQHHLIRGAVTLLLAVCFFLVRI